MSAYGNKLDPYRAARRALGAKGIRSSDVITNNPSTIDQNQLLTIRFPNLGNDDVIVPGSARVAFTITLTNGTGTPDANRTIVNNLGRAIIKKISIKMEGTEIYCLDDSDRYLCYRDLWLTDKERTNSSYQGIQNVNTGRIRVGAGNAVGATQPDASIAAAYGNRFFIPLDFELLTDHMPFYQSGLTDRLSFELTFNDYGQVMVSANNTATYIISNIALEFDKVTHSELARSIRMQYSGQVAILYTRVLRHRKLAFNKSDVTWNINLNTPARSLKGVLLLFEDPAAGAMGPAFGRNSESFYNPLITKVQVTVEGIPNQLYAQGLLPYQHWDEAIKGNFRETLRDSELPFTDQTRFFLTSYGLWLDFRTGDDQTVHGSGRRIENASEGITVQLDKTAQAAGALNCYVYLLLDAQMNISEGKLHSYVW